MAISALAASLRMLFQLKPDIHVLIAGAVRNWDTFNSFVFACGKWEINFKHKHYVFYH
jgi:hypothetical protein